MVQPHRRQSRIGRGGAARQVRRCNRRLGARTVGAAAATPAVVAERAMRSAFGRRVVELPGRELVLVPDKAPPPTINLAGRDELRERIRSALMSRIDPSVARRIGEDTL